jgi:signal transduction histidine kinase
LSSRLYSERYKRSEKEAMMESPIKILCLEDQEEDFEMIELFLKKSGLHFISKRVDTEQEYVQAIDEFVPDIILSDHSLPQFNSFEALKICSQQKRIIPFILVTGAMTEEFAVDCIKHGAEDYVLKSNLSRLYGALKNALKHKALEQEKQSAAAVVAEQNRSLVKINSELDSFVYSVSHNLRAPLMSLLGLINLTKYEDDLETIRQYHNKMEHTIHDLDGTLKEILDYSRNSRQDMVIERVDLKKAIKENLDRLKYMPGFDRLEVRLNIERSTVFLTDRYRLSVVLNNLISNAIKYQDFNREKSYLHIDGVVHAQSMVLQFKDNGIGIPEPLIDKIFNMFYRATEHGDGSGLGLYIVKEAVEKMQGQIEVNSQTGVGSDFRITLRNHLL